MGYIKFTGTFGKIYFEGKNDYHVVAFKGTDENGSAVSTRAVGNYKIPDIRFEYELDAEWKNDKRFGLQLIVQSCEPAGPKAPAAASSQETAADTREGWIKYLSSYYFSRVSVVIATAIVDTFELKELDDILCNHPEQLIKVKGIGPKVANGITETHKRLQNTAFQSLTLLNLTKHQIEQLVKRYGEQATEVVKKTPYAIIHEIKGFGFKTVDSIALKNGFAPDCRERIGAAITFILREIASNGGHCWLTVGSLEAQLTDLIPGLDVQVIAEVLAGEIEQERVVNDDGKLYSRDMYETECECASLIAQMLRTPPLVKFPVDLIEKAIHIMEYDTGFTLEEAQKRAITCALSNRLSVITGGPGTGKSTIIRGILSAWRLRRNLDTVCLCAPTGKAAQRMTEVTGVKAQTIHRVVYMNTRMSKNDETLMLDDWETETGESDNNAPTLSNTLIIVDESSMPDIRLARMLLRLAANNNQLVLIGDVDQLPPIGPGSFFRDCVQSPLVPTVRLTLSHRQQGVLNRNANRINNGEGIHSLCLDDPAFVFVEADKDHIRQVVVDEYLKAVNEYGLTEVCCIMPMRQRSQTGTDELNKQLRDMINPEIPDAPVMVTSRMTFRIGDRVMNTKNNYAEDIYNGDTGIITAINPEWELFEVFMDDGKTHILKKDLADQFVLAYAMTVHKAQGSEFKAVITAQSMEHYVMLQRNLLYTAVTRAKQKVVLCGEKKAVATSISKNPALNRNTQLRQRIQAAVTST